MEYKEFIELLTNGKIKSLRFSLKDYAHYRDCLMEYERDSQGTMSPLIFFTLTRDGAEKISFYKSFNEKEKIFNLGRAGKFTLAQMWKKIIINDIEYYN